MTGRRLALIGIVAAVGIVPVLVVAALQVVRSPDAGPSAVERARAVGGVALSSPVDPGAKFFWELPERPRSLIPLDEVVSGGPPPDGIPAIDRPQFVPISEVDFLGSEEPVIAFERNGDVRAYPIQILTWHEIVNDVVGGEPVAVTFCPLCNSAIVFDRRVGDLVLDFGTSGRLFKSDLVMYDRQTKSLWPQIERRAVVGTLIGQSLSALPSQMISWGEWRAAHPGGTVLSRQTGFNRSYGQNPYTGYDTPGSSPFLFSGEADPRLPAIARVLAVEFDGDAKAYPFDELKKGAPTTVADRIGKKDVVVFFALGTRSALDRSEIARGRDVGATGVFSPVVGGRLLHFTADANGFSDRETGSRWSLLGRAVSGPLKGSQLDPVEHIDTFWFAWAAFKPDTVIWRTSS